MCISHKVVQNWNGFNGTNLSPRHLVSLGAVRAGFHMTAMTVKRV